MGGFAIDIESLEIYVPILEEVAKMNVMERELVGYSLMYGLKNLFMACIQIIKSGE